MLHNQLCGDPSGSPRRGEYCLLDWKDGGLVSHTVFQPPGAMGKGVLVTPTVHGNLSRPHCHGSAGPGRHCYHPDGLDHAIATAAARAEPAHAGRHYQLAGLRFHLEGGAATSISGEQRELLRGHRHRVPGLSSAPAIGVYVAGLVAEKLGLAEKPDFIAQRRDIVHVRELPLSERQALVERDPAYGNILCRCEQISEGEIRDAIRRTPGARSLDGVKRRVRAGMGRCQGGFCAPRVMELLSEELGVPQTQLTKSGGGSLLLTGETKEVQA
ncbi:MAG: (2Fe-2S)-binding protein [Oscillospiraceae bacterium]